MKTKTANMEDVKGYLLRIQEGSFEPDDYIGAWFNPAVSEYFIEQAVEIVPKGIRWSVGLPFRCHLNALTYAAEHPGAKPIFGMQYLEWASVNGKEVGTSWEVHSCVVETDGTIVDS